MMWWSNGWGGAAWFGFALMHVLFWVLLIACIVLLARWAEGSRAVPPPAGEGRAMDILRERYARGEIDKQEFEERRQVLKGTSGGPHG